MNLVFGSVFFILAIWNFSVAFFDKDEQHIQHFNNWRQISFFTGSVTLLISIIFFLNQFNLFN